MLIRVNLDPTEREALRRLAVAERRREEAQAALIIRRELERRGLLPADAPAAQPQAAEGVAHD
jgi:hypothetical protein